MAAMASRQRCPTQRKSFSSSLGKCYPPPILRQRVAGNALIITDLTLRPGRKSAKDERLKYSLLTVYKSRQDSLSACGWTPGHSDGLRSTTVQDRMTLERLNDIFTIKCHQNPPYVGHARQFGQIMSSILSDTGISTRIQRPCGLTSGDK